MRIILDAVGDNGRRFGHNCCRRTSPNLIKQEASINKLISTLFIKSIKSLQRRPKNEHVQGRPPLRWHGFIKPTLLKGRAAPTPWWCWLSCWLCFMCGFWLVTCQSYSSYIHFRGVTKWVTHACTIPITQWLKQKTIFFCAMIFSRHPKWINPIYGCVGGI